VTDLAYAGCFLALAVVSGLAAASGRGWALRLPLLAVTPVLALAVWWQLTERDGWPTRSRPPDGSAFVAGVIQAPSPSNAGAIYLWTQPPHSATPRSYRLPYSRELERQVGAAARTAKRGGHIGLRTERTTNHVGHRGRGDSDGSSPALRFYRLSSPASETKAPSG
jgi:hypothetical protein